MNSLKLNLKKSILQIILDEDESFTVVWITIMRKCNENSVRLAVIRKLIYIKIT